MKKKEGKRACWHMSRKTGLCVGGPCIFHFSFSLLFNEGFAREIHRKGGHRRGVCVQGACVPILVGLAHCTIHHGQKHNHKHKRKRKRIHKHKHKHKHEHGHGYGHKMRGRPDTLLCTLSLAAHNILAERVQFFSSILGQRAFLVCVHLWCCAYEPTFALVP